MLVSVVLSLLFVGRDVVSVIRLVVLIVGVSVVGVFDLVRLNVLNLFVCLLFSVEIFFNSLVSRLSLDLDLVVSNYRFVFSLNWK